MADIRISALPNEPAPSGSDFVAIDLATARKTTVTLLTEAGRPAASQAEAEAGTDPTKAMTPLTTAQAIAALGSTQFVPVARTVTAGTGLTGGGALSGDITLDVDLGVTVQAWDAALDSLAGLSLQGGDILYATGSDTLARLPIGTVGQVLQISGSNPTWANIAGTGDVIGPASSVTGNIPSFTNTTGKVLSDSGIPATSIQSATAGHLYGLTMSNAAGDPTNDITTAAGSAASSDTLPYEMVLGSAITKQLDAAWAVGNNAGGRMSAAAIANTTYHVFLIRRPDTGVVDVGFDVSATAPTMPANYTQFRRIGSIMRESGAIVTFRQVGDMFKRGVFTANSSTTAYGPSLTYMGVPLGIQVQPIILSTLQVAASSSANVQIGDAAHGSIEANISGFTSIAGLSPPLRTTVPSGFITNTSGQLYSALSIGSGTVTAQSLGTIGWADTRGRT